MSNYHENDYRPIVDRARPTRYLDGTAIEIVTEVGGRRPRHVLFDFDGTLSLIREGWPNVMVPMMVEVLQATGSGEDATGLAETVRQFVMQLNGKQTIYQMIRLAEEVSRRGGTPDDPQQYKAEYHRRLMARIAGRREALASGRLPPAEMLVPGSMDLLAELQRRDTVLYLASGTDEAYVIEEARLLGLEPFFGARIYGAKADFRSFSKAMVIEQILAENGVEGAELLGFGDGYVEIENIKAAGGTAIAVASDEKNRSGKPDPWKRERLIGVGADCVVPDFRQCGALVAWLWGEP